MRRAGVEARQERELPHGLQIASDDEALHVNIHQLVSEGASLHATRLVVDILRFVWWPQREPVSLQPGELKRRLDAAPGLRDSWSIVRIEKELPDIEGFFRRRRDGRYDPCPQFFEVSVLSQA